MKNKTRERAAVVITDHCDYVIQKVLCWGYEVTVRATFEGSRSEDSFTSRPFKTLADAFEMIARLERQHA